MRSDFSLKTCIVSKTTSISAYPTKSKPTEIAAKTNLGLGGEFTEKLVLYAPKPYGHTHSTQGNYHIILGTRMSL